MLCLCCLRRRSAAAIVPPTKPTRLVGAVPCDPVSSLLKGLIRGDVNLLNIGDHGHDLRHQRGLLTSPLARAAMSLLSLYSVPVTENKKVA